MPHDQQAVEQTKRDCRDDEQIHRRDAVGMIIEKCFPTLGRRASTSGHILGHARLPDIDAELEKLAVDPRRSPQRIGSSRGLVGVFQPEQSADHHGVSTSSASRI